MPTQKFACWDANNEGEIEAEQVEAYDPEEAAGNWCQQKLVAGELEAPYDGIEVAVRLPDGTLQKFDISVDYEPTFSATLSDDQEE